MHIHVLSGLPFMRSNVDSRVAIPGWPSHRARKGCHLRPTLFLRARVLVWLLGDFVTLCVWGGMVSRWGVEDLVVT